MRRILPAQKLSKSPLVHVLAQVRFSPVHTMDQHVIGVHERLRGLAFPRFEKSEVQLVTLGPGSKPKFESADRWDFLDRDKTVGVVLTNSFVVLQTSRYDTYERFSAVLRSVLEALKATVDVAVAERLGLRYVDLVRLQAGETFGHYLNAGLIGFPFASVPHLTTEATFFRTESLAQTPQGTLAVRCLHSDKGSILPPDLSPSGLEYGVELGPGEAAAILDFDHFDTKARDFDVGGLMESMDQLHDAVDLAFRAAVTDHALTIWGKEPRC